MRLCARSRRGSASDVPVGNQPFDLPSACAFPVHVTPTTDNEGVKIFTSGTVLITGALKTTLTNTNTGKSIAVNTSGPAKITVENGVATLHGKGRGLLFANAGDISLGSPGLLLVTSGPVNLVLAPGVAPVQVGGTATDLCPLLAGG